MKQVLNNFNELQKKIFIISGVLILVFVAMIFIKNFDGPEEKKIQREYTYKFEQPELYNEPLIIKTFKNTFSIKPVNASANSAAIIDEKNPNMIKYIDAYKNTDVVQIKTNNKLKENILLKQSGHPDKFEYELNLENYEFEKNEQGDLIFYVWGKKDQELYKVFTIPQSFMIEASISNPTAKDIGRVAMEIEGDKLILIPDQEWIRNHNYPIIVDPTIEINILNIHSHPQQGENWEVEFTTLGQADLYIIPNDQATIDDDQFESLSCDGEIRTPQILANDVIFYPDWECSGIAKVIHYTLTAGQHTLRFEFGGTVAYAYNSTASPIIFATATSKVYNFVDVTTSSNDYYAYEKKGATYFTSPADHGDSEATNTDYNNIESSNNVRWTTGDASTDGHFESQLYNFYITEDEADIYSLDLTWEGYGETRSSYYTWFKIWNYLTSNWYELDKIDFESAVDQKVTYKMTTNVDQYIDTDGEVTLTAYTKKYVEEAPAAECGNGILEGEEICDSDFTDECPNAHGYFQGSFQDGGCMIENPVACNNSCDTCADQTRCEGIVVKCPFIYSWDGIDYIFDNEALLWTGLKWRETNTNERLPNLVLDNNKYKLKITEELAEIVYWDKLQLLAIDHPQGTEVYSDVFNNYYTIKNPQKPISCIDEYDEDCLSIISKKDDIRWNMLPHPKKNFEDLDQDGLSDSTDESNYYSYIELEFERKGNRAKILHNPLQSKFSSNQYKESLKMIGDNNMDFLEQLVLDGTYDQLESDLLNNIWLWDGEEWVQEHFAKEMSASTKSPDMIIPLDLTNINTPTIKIRYKSATGLGGPDYIWMDFSEEEPIEKIIVPVSSANFTIANEVERGNEIGKLAEDDSNYLVFDTGDYGFIEFDALPNLPIGKRTLFTESNGYYYYDKWSSDIDLTDEKKEYIKNVFSDKLLSMRYFAPKIFKDNCGSSSFPLHRNKVLDWGEIIKEFNPLFEDFGNHNSLNTDYVELKVTCGTGASVIFKENIILK